MTEQLLQFIWQFRHFNSADLQCTNAQQIQIIHLGNYNTNQGPDFVNAKIKVDETVWAGNIEIHINASDWNAHKHSTDINYKNIILHVVWNNDVELTLPFPTLVLQNRVSGILLNRYKMLMQSQKFIPCEEHISSVSDIVLMAWKERLLAERLQQKANSIQQYLQQNKQHWEETFWWLIARNFGAKINSDAFELIAKSLPLTILAKHKNQLHQVEALLFGQSGLLNKNFEDDYAMLLKKEYLFLQKKYQLQKVHAHLHFLRMRPANFPSIRLAQLAMLIHQSLHLFSTIKEATDINDVKKLLDVTANDYWHYHYVFDEAATFKKKVLGEQMKQNIIINTIVPVLYAYGYLNKNELYTNKALQWLMQTAAETNVITKGFKMLSIENKNAFDSQALIQLKNTYCNHRRCLQCAIGNAVLKIKN
jgi:hypothetical protein